MINNLVIATATDGAKSITTTEERTIFATVGDVLMAPISDLLADDTEYVQKRTRGYAAATHLTLGVLAGEFWGQKRARSGKGPLIPFLKVA